MHQWNGMKNYIELSDHSDQICIITVFMPRIILLYFGLDLLLLSHFYELLFLVDICPEATLFLFLCQHRPPMKKVRKSLALDVMDCQAMPKSKRKSLKNELKHSIKVMELEILLFLLNTHL